MTHFFFRSMCSKVIIGFGFCDIQNNQGLGKGYQPKPKADAMSGCVLGQDTFTLTVPLSTQVNK